MNTIQVTTPCGVVEGFQEDYTYYFRRQLPGDANGAWHGSDLIYLYGWLSHS